MDESMLHAWERPQMPTKFIRVLSGWDYLGDVGVYSIRIASKLFQSFVSHIYRFTFTFLQMQIYIYISADAEDHTASYAIFTKS